MKRWVFLILAITSILPVYADDKAHRTDNTLVQSINTITHAYTTANTISADFTQTVYIPLLEKHTTKTGKIYLSKGGKLRIDYLVPHKVSYISNGKKLWISDASISQIREYKLNSKVVPKEALDFLTGFGNITKSFRVSASNSNVSASTIHLLLQPRRKSAGYDKLDCTFGKDGLLKKLVIHNKSGNTSTYNFYNIKTNVQFPAHLFKKPQAKTSQG